jgi:hypothetical protein
MQTDSLLEKLHAKVAAAAKAGVAELLEAETLAAEPVTHQVAVIAEHAEVLHTAA